MDEPNPDAAAQQDPQRRVCVVGSGWQFTSGISYYTCSLVSALSERYLVSALLMRRLIPRRMYPGRDRVGEPMHSMKYPAGVPVFDGVDWFWFPSMLCAIRFLMRERPSVLVLQWWTGAVLHSYVILVLVARKLGAKVIVEYHETQDTGEARIRGATRYLRAVARWLLSRTDAFVVHSTFDRDRISQMFPAAGRPLYVLPHGPFGHYRASNISRPTQYDAMGGPAKLHDRDDITTLLFFGTIRPYKGLETLVEAFDSLTFEAAAKMRLLIVGETWEGWSHPVQAALASRHQERITVLNRYVSDDEVAVYFEMADAVVLPYLRSSASGPLHIAMAYGLPVVLTTVGGLPEGAAGYAGVTWVPPGDVNALRAALLDLPDMRNMRFQDPRSWSDSLNVYDRIFADLDSLSDCEPARVLSSLSTRPPRHWQPWDGSCFISLGCSVCKLSAACATQIRGQIHRRISK